MNMPKSLCGLESYRFVPSDIFIESIFQLLKNVKVSFKRNSPFLPLARFRQPNLSQIISIGDI